MLANQTAVQNIGESEIIVVELGVDERGADGEERDIEGPGVFKGGLQAEDVAPI